MVHEHFEGVHWTRRQCPLHESHYAAHLPAPGPESPPQDGHTTTVKHQTLECKSKTARLTVVDWLSRGKTRQLPQLHQGELPVVLLLRLPLRHNHHQHTTVHEPVLPCRVVHVLCMAWHGSGTSTSTLSWFHKKKREKKELQKVNANSRRSFFLEETQHTIPTITLFSVSI